MSIPDFHIVGSGWAGAMLGYRLADKFDVTVIERNVPGEKYCCGGGLPLSVIESLELDVPYKLISEAIIAVNDKHYWYPLRYAVANRGALDKAMADKAKNAGVNYVQAAFKSLDQEKSIVSLKIEGKIIHQQYKKLVFASGLQTDISEYKLGYDWRNRDYATAMMEIIPEESPFGDSLFLACDNEILPAGYFWIFPIGDGTIDVGCGRLQRTKSEEPLGKILERFKEKYKITAKSQMTRSARLSAGATARVQNGNLYAFGDAAGMIQPVTGEGLKYIYNVSEKFSDCLKKGGNLNGRWMRSFDYAKLFVGERILKMAAPMEARGIPVYGGLLKWICLTRTLGRKMPVSLPNFN